MDKRISCKTLYNLINSKEMIASGSESNIYKNSSNSLFKFRAGYFANALGLEKEDMENLTLDQIELAIQIRHANSIFQAKRKRKRIEESNKNG